MHRRHALIALAAAAAACSTACEAPERRGQVGQPAPAYAAYTPAGDTVSLASLRGQVVLLNVWATWCPPCREEIPELQALHERYSARGLRVIGVSVDAAGADDAVQRFAQDIGMTYDVLRDPGERVSSTFRIQGVPATMLIDRQGTLVWRHIGPVTAEDPQLLQALEGALAAPAPATAG